MPRGEYQRKCKVCQLPKVREIEAGLVLKDTNFSKLERAYPGLSRHAFRRHFTNHVSVDRRKRIYAEETEKRELQANSTAHGIVESDKIDVMLSLKNLSEECRALLKKAKDDKDNEFALKTITELRRQVELAARILGDLTDTQNNTIIIHSHPEWQKVRSVILGILERHPEAKADFIQTIGALGNGDRKLISG
jgi:hypothetical protein